MLWINHRGRSRRLRKVTASADGSLFRDRSAIWVIDDCQAEILRVARPEIRTDLLGKAWSTGKDAAPHRDLQIGTRANFANGVDDLSNSRSVARARCVEQQDIGRPLADIFQNFVTRNTAAGETNFVTVDFQLRHHNLGIELLRRTMAAEQQDSSAVRGLHLWSIGHSLDHSSRGKPQRAHHDRICRRGDAILSPALFDLGQRGRDDFGKKLFGLEIVSIKTFIQETPEHCSFTLQGELKKTFDIWFV